MLFDFTEAERNTARRALEIYVSELIDEIGKTRDASGGNRCARKGRSSDASSNS